jgi:signal peptidase II
VTDHAADHSRESRAATAALGVRGYKSGGAWFRFLIPAILGLTADLALKAWSFPDGVPVEPMMGAGRAPAGIAPPDVIIPGILRFTTTVNHGAVFGIGQGYVFVFLAFSLVALGIILWAFLTSFKKQWVVHIALGLITAGALGNLWDRAIHHGVRDMLQFYASWYQYIFNLADVLLCIGVPLLMVRWLFWNDTPARTRTASLEAPAAAPPAPENPST